MKIIKKIFKFLPLASLIVSCAFAVEGDIIKDRHGCYLEKADGVEVEIACPQIEDKGLSPKDKNDLVDLLKIFEESPVAATVKQASKALNSDKKAKHSYSKEVLKKAKKLENGKYVVKITFLKKSDYPKKSNLGHGYFASDNGTFQVLDSTAEAQWDEIISTDLIGNDHAKYQAYVNAVTSKNVIITVRLSNSYQLASIVKGKNIKDIDHVGLPDVVYEEIIR
jgi:hypothetical protein